MHPRLGHDADQSGQRQLALGQRETGTAGLEEAVVAYEAALEIFDPAGATYYVILFVAGTKIGLVTI